MKRHLCIAIGLTVLGGIALACSPFAAPTPTPTPPPPPPSPTPTAIPPSPTPSASPTIPFTVYNDSSVVICYLFISPPESEEWGEDWLGPDEMIGIGGSRTFQVPPGTYDLKAADCDGNPIDIEWRADLSEETTWAISLQTLNPTSEPNFGDVSLEAGFTPDPFVFDLTSGGNIDVGMLDLGEQCYGYASAEPDFRVFWSGTSDNLRFFFVAANRGDDTTLLVNDPNGDWHCNDDFGSTLDPLVDISNPPPGQYDIWVGSFELDTYINGTLYITEGDYSPEKMPSQGGGVLLQDDFSDPDSGWSVDAYSDGSSAGYADGSYVIRGAGEGLIMWGVAGRDFTDVVVDVDATQVLAGPNDNNAYGIYCRVQPGGEGDGYGLMITGDGYYIIVRIVNGDYEELVSWTPSDAIRQGNATNHLRAICDGDYLALIVNGELLAETNDSTYASGDVGLAAGTMESGPTEVHFDNLVVRAP